MNDAWQVRAACRGQDVELFFPFKETSAQADRAKAFCRVCPVTAQCLKLAIDTNSSDGIFGGMTTTERALWRSGNYEPDYSIIGHRDMPGTLAGYYREKTAGLIPCDECRDAFNAYSRAQQRRYREAKRVAPSARAIAARDEWLSKNGGHAGIKRRMTHPLIGN